MADTIKYIKKIQLSDNSVYYIRDSEAIHTDGGSITGNLTVDGYIKTNDLYILSIEYIATTPSNVLVLDEVTGEVKKRDIDNLLEDIGGISYSIDDATGTLSLKYGRQ